MVSTVDVGGYPYGIAYDPEVGEVFVANQGSNNVSVISDGTNKVLESIPLLVASDPEQVVYGPGTGSVFVAEWGRDAVAVISDVTNTVVTTISVGLQPIGLAYDSGLSEVFVSNFGSNNVSVISEESDSVVASIDVGANPLGVTYDSGTNQVFVANSGGDTVSVIDDGSNSVAATVTVGAYPYGVAYDPSVSEVFVSNYFTPDSSSSLSVVSDATDEAIQSVPVGANPYGVTARTEGGRVFVSNFGSDTLGVVSDLTDTMVRSVSVGNGPIGVAYDAGMQEVFVANYYSDNVSVLSDQAEFPVSFEASQLPVGTQWYANITGGAGLHGSTSALATSLPNGTYTYRVASTNKTWSATPGTFTVNDAPLTVTVTFVLQTYPLRLVESGLPQKALAKHGWTVTFLDAAGGSETTYGTHNATIPSGHWANGTYGYLIRGPSGYVVTGISPAGKLTVRGATTLEVTFAKGRTYTVTFKERGLTAGTSWAVIVGQLWEWSETSTVKFVDLSPGAYAYQVAQPVAGQDITARIGRSAASPNGTLAISKNTRVTLTFAYKFTVSFSETGLTGGTWTTTVKGVTASAPWNAPIVFRLVNGTYRYSVGHEPGFVASGGHARVDGAAVAIDVTYASEQHSSNPSLDVGRAAVRSQEGAANERVTRPPNPASVLSGLEMYSSQEAVPLIIFAREMRVTGVHSERFARGSGSGRP